MSDIGSTLSSIIEPPSVSSMGTDVFYVPPIKSRSKPCDWVLPAIGVLGVILFAGIIYYYWCDWDHNKNKNKNKDNTQYTKDQLYDVMENMDGRGANSTASRKWSGHAQDVDADGLKNYLSNFDVVVVAFVATQCGHCTQCKPALHQAAQKSNKPVLTLHSHRNGVMDLCRQLGIVGFPTIIKLSKNGKVGEEYNGDRSAHSFVEYMNK